MDLVASVRKDGNRGGRGEFQWSDVQSSQHRENYLGHSVMAPVGRWQQGRDLQWYARDKAPLETEGSARREFQDEIQRIKQAENEALSKALGYDVSSGGLSSSSVPGTGSNSVAIERSRITKSEAAQPKQETSRKRERSRDRRKTRHRSRSPARREERRGRSGDRDRHRKSRRRSRFRSRSSSMTRSKHYARSRSPDRATKYERRNASRNGRHRDTGRQDWHGVQDRENRYDRRDQYDRHDRYGRRSPSPRRRRDKAALDRARSP